MAFQILQQVRHQKKSVRILLLGPLLFLFDLSLSLAQAGPESSAQFTLEARPTHGVLHLKAIPPTGHKVNLKFPQTLIELKSNSRNIPRTISEAELIFELPIPTESPTWKMSLAYCSGPVCKLDRRILQWNSKTHEIEFPDRR